MNAPFDPVSFIHRLEAEGIAPGIEDRNRELATRAEIEKLSHEMKRVATNAELKLEPQTALARQTVRFGAMFAATIGLAAAILGTTIALR